MKRLRKVGFGEVRYPGVLIREDDEATLIDGLCRRCRDIFNRERDENDSVFDRLKVPEKAQDTEVRDIAEVGDNVEVYHVEGCELCELERSFREAEEELEKVGISS